MQSAALEQTLKHCSFAYYPHCNDTKQVENGRSFILRRRHPPPVVSLWVLSSSLTRLLAQWKLSVSSNWLLRRADGWNRHTGCSPSPVSQFISPQRPLLSLSLYPSLRFLTVFIFPSDNSISNRFQWRHPPLLSNWFTAQAERRLTLYSMPQLCLVVAFRLFWFLYCIPCLFSFLAFFSACLLISRSLVLLLSLFIPLLHSSLSLSLIHPGNHHFTLCNAILALPSVISTADLTHQCTRL